MKKIKYNKYICIHIILNFVILILLFGYYPKYCSHKKQEIAETVVSQIYTNIAYNLAMPDYVEIQRQIDDVFIVPEIKDIVVIDKFGGVVSANSFHQKKGDSQTVHTILFNGKKVGTIGICLNQVVLKSMFRKKALVVAFCYFLFFPLSTYFVYRITNKKNDTNHRLITVGNLASCITSELKHPITEIGNYFNETNSNHVSTVNKIKKYIENIEEVSEKLPEDEVESINDYVNDTISSCRRMDKMKRNVVPIPMYAGKHLSKMSKI